jgi:hypothetical protein
MHKRTDAVRLPPLQTDGNGRKYSRNSWLAGEGEPATRRVSAGVPHNCARSSSTPEIQSGLARRGYAPVPVAAKIVIKPAERLSPN